MNNKPVLWQWLNTAQVRRKVPDYAIKSDWKPLYTTPQTKPLSDEEIESIGRNLLSYWDSYDEGLTLFARAIEERHGIK
jgi:hypothetical protein